MDSSLIQKRSDSCSRQYIIFSRVYIEEVSPSILSFVSLLEPLKYQQNATYFLYEPVESLKQLSREMPINCFCLSQCLYSVT